MADDSAAAILLVEDDPDIAEVIEIILVGEGFTVRHAPDGKAALDLLYGGMVPRLILLDLMMPVMNGWHFRAEQLRDPVLAAIPVLVMTGAGDATTEDVRLLGERVLRKPLDKAELLQIIKRAAKSDC